MKKTSDNNAIVSGPIGKQLILFFIPVWLGLLFQQLYNTVDTLVVGQFVGTNAVAAVGNVAFVVQLLIGLCAGIAGGAGVIISQHYGAEKHEQVKIDIRCSLVIALVGGVLFSILGVAMAETSVRWLNTPEEIVADSTIYLQVYFCAMVPALIYNFGTAILRGLGDSKRPLYVLIVASIVNIVLDLVFVIAFDWGVFGVALATDIAQIVSAILVIILLVRTQPGIFKGSVKHASVYGNIFRLGVPGAIQSMMYSFSNLLIQAAVNGFGTAVIAAWTIYGKVDCLNWMTTSAMGMAVTSFAGQNYGAGRYDRVKRCAKLGNLYLGTAVLVIVVILYVWAYPLFAFFSKDAEVVELGVGMMRFLAPAYMLFFPEEVYSGALRGCGDVKVPTIVSIIGTCLVRVLWIQFVVPLWNTMENVMLCYVVTWALVTGFFIVYFARGKWLARCIAGRG
ncbi:MAG: MATE family efflux transporter [Lachnospiraceae bacterium]|nr:MATE family efflux transporter [Lachnospiraceae bacterium]